MLADEAEPPPLPQSFGVPDRACGCRVGKAQAADLDQVLVLERRRNVLTDDERGRWRAATRDGSRVRSPAWARSRVDTQSASGCNHCAASVASWKVLMRKRPTRRSGSASGTLSLTRTAARVPASCASWARKKFTMQATKLLVGRAARRRSMRIRRSRGRTGASRISRRASSNSVNVQGSMSRSSALGRSGNRNHVTAMRQPPSMTVRGSRRPSVAHFATQIRCRTPEGMPGGLLDTVLRVATIRTVPRQGSSIAPMTAFHFLPDCGGQLGEGRECAATQASLFSQRPQGRLTLPQDPCNLVVDLDVHLIALTAGGLTPYVSASATRQASATGARRSFFPPGGVIPRTDEGVRCLIPQHYRADPVESERPVQTQCHRGRHTSALVTVRGRAERPESPKLIAG